MAKVCRISWAGDKNSMTVWKDLSIEFRSGDNLDMLFNAYLRCSHLKTSVLD